MKNPFTGYEPPEGTELTVIHDIYGMAIHVYFPVGDKIAPRNCEIGICSAQLGMKVEEHKAMAQKEKEETQ